MHAGWTLIHKSQKNSSNNQIDQFGCSRRINENHTTKHKFFSACDIFSTWGCDKTASDDVQDEIKLFVSGALKGTKIIFVDNILGFSADSFCDSLQGML